MSCSLPAGLHLNLTPNPYALPVAGQKLDASSREQPQCMAVSLCSFSVLLHKLCRLHMTQNTNMEMSRAIKHVAYKAAEACVWLQPQIWLSGQLAMRIHGSCVMSATFLPVQQSYSIMLEIGTKKACDDDHIL